MAGQKWYVGINGACLWEVNEAGQSTVFPNAGNLCAAVEQHLNEQDRIIAALLSEMRSKSEQYPGDEDEWISMWTEDDLQQIIEDARHG